MEKQVIGQIQGKMNPLVSFCAVTFIMMMITTIKMMMMITMSVTMVVVIMTTRNFKQKTSCHISWRVWWISDKLPWTPEQDVQSCFQPELFCSVLREEKFTLVVPFQTRSIKRPWGLKKICLQSQWEGFREVRWGK